MEVGHLSTPLLSKHTQNDADSNDDHLNSSLEQLTENFQKLSISPDGETIDTTVSANTSSENTVLDTTPVASISQTPDVPQTLKAVAPSEDPKAIFGAMGYTSDEINNALQWSNNNLAIASQFLESCRLNYDLMAKKIFQHSILFEHLKKAYVLISNDSSTVTCNPADIQKMVTRIFIYDRTHNDIDVYQRFVHLQGLYYSNQNPVTTKNVNSLTSPIDQALQTLLIELEYCRAIEYLVELAGIKRKEAESLLLSNGYDVQLAANKLMSVYDGSFS